MLRFSSSFQVLSTSASVLLVLYSPAMALLPVYAQSSSSWRQILDHFRRPVEVGTPRGKNQAGANRDCFTAAPATAILLTAFVPRNNSGLTRAAHPTFWFYMPYSAPATSNPVEIEMPVEFALIEVVKNGRERELYQQRYALPSKEGLFSITLPEDIPELEFDKQYSWVLSVRCQTANSSSETSISGKIKRVELDSDMEEKLNAANTWEKEVHLYSEANLWYDMINLVAQHQQNDSVDPEIADLWNHVLGFVGLCSLMHASSTSYCNIPLSSLEEIKINVKSVNPSHNE